MISTKQYNALTEHEITIHGLSALYYTAENKSVCEHQSIKKTAHFFGGNGFATGVYTPLLNELSEQFNMVSLAMRGCWHDKPSAKKLTREEDADILIQFLEQTQSEPVVGIGHSQGATSTAIACAKRPDLFSALYLLEPVTFTRKQVRLYNLLPSWILHRNEPFKSTLTKQDIWHSYDEYYNFLRKKNSFKRLSDENLRIYVDNSLEKTDTGLALVFPAKQELANYFGVPFIDDALLTINKQGIPYHLIIGKPSIFVSDAVRAEWKKIVSTEVTIHKDYGHLLPVEAPLLCAQTIRDLATS